jgi:hypothetical protein
MIRTEVEEAAEDGLGTLSAGKVRSSAATLSVLTRPPICAPVQQLADDGHMTAYVREVQRPPAPTVPRLDVGPDPEEEGDALDVPAPREAHEPRALLAAVPDVLAGDEEVRLATEGPREEREPAALVRVAVEGDEAADVEESDLESRDGEAVGAGGAGGAGGRGGRRACACVGLGRHGEGGDRRGGGERRARGEKGNAC